MTARAGRLPDAREALDVMLRGDASPDVSILLLLDGWLQRWGAKAPLAERALLGQQLIALIEHSGVPIRELWDGTVEIAVPE